MPPTGVGSSTAAIFVKMLATAGVGLLREILEPIKNLFFSDEDVIKEIDNRIDERFRQNSVGAPGGQR